MDGLNVWEQLTSFTFELANIWRIFNLEQWIMDRIAGKSSLFNNLVSKNVTIEKKN